jgi:hypothetical protein
MANPYPPQMPPMMQQPGQAPYGPPGQPPMQQMQPPPGMPPRPAVVRRGTSRAVPVVVSAGLAIGVFCGLLFGLGTGDEVIASPSTGNNVKPDDPNEPKIPIPNTVGSSTTVKTPAATPTTTTTTTTTATVPPAAGSAAGSAGGSAAGSGSAAPATATAGAGSGSAAPATPAPKIYKVKFKLIPDTLAKSATITVDGKEIEGTELDVDLGTADKKSIKVVVKAAGYRSYEKTLSVEGDTDMQVEMTKRPASVPSGPRPGGGGGRKNGGNSGGGLIDI